MSDILIRIEGRAGRITLNRPETLNSLTYDMLRAIDAALEEWRDDDRVALVLIDAAGARAFAAGGDIRDLYETGRAGDFAFGQGFWAFEYRLNAKIARYPKPYVAIMHGFVMGGGVGVSALGSHRVVTDGTEVAMPECGIGLVPDVGGSWLLANAPGRAGEYLGMTGARMGPADAIHAGFADAYVPSDRLEALKTQLAESGDPGEIRAFAEKPEGGELAYFRLPMDDAFAAASTVELEANLEEVARAGLPWATKTLKALRRGCPLSVATTMEMVRAARSMTLEEALAQEYRFTARCMEHGEFLEGVRAAVIDKDRDPHWAKPRLADVRRPDVDAMLAPLGADELKL
ncbi:enoyl-CoA hydratase/isomerase family protein [Pikeienuella piscinae]|uniref:3-hydroxyisobutyryl-CoA hydrolase n=1 Tax=Pikeienuella piscinae TaxID=2748098 RepID=A0A7M3T623_9RHOB|nr:3-hydroxyisobutyryl-CoA hydrolase [Pikeienuella piscinae]QIE57454.1 enoyl-CoA hydratase/isomerase family protein [Pikeienuella piscinae]